MLLLSHKFAGQVPLGRVRPLWVCHSEHLYVGPPDFLHEGIEIIHFSPFCVIGQLLSASLCWSIVCTRDPQKSKMGAYTLQ